MQPIERKPELENKWLQLNQSVGEKGKFLTHIFAIPGLGVVMRTTLMPTASPYPSPGSVSTTLLPNAVVFLVKSHRFSFDLVMEYDDGMGIRTGKVFTSADFVASGDEEIEIEFPPQDE